MTDRHLIGIISLKQEANALDEGYSADTTLLSHRCYFPKGKTKSQEVRRSCRRVSQQLVGFNEPFRGSLTGQSQRSVTSRTNSQPNSCIIWAF